MARRKDTERAEARRLREEGWSLRRIAVHLGVSLSSASAWVGDVPRREPAGDAPGATGVATREVPSGTRRCSACQQELPLAAFNRAGDDRQWWCRQCFRDYFRKRGALHRSQSRDARRRRQERAKNFVLDHLARHPCLDCGERDPIVLEFDHVGAKSDHVSRMISQGVSPEALARELGVCEVVCVNCHRRRTARRGNWRRARADWRSAPCRRLPHERRNLDLAYSVLVASGCVDCEVDDLCVLEFDHVSGKRGNVTTLAGRGCSTARLLEEIDRCVVRCGNCHRRRTAREGGHYRHVAPKL